MALSHLAWYDVVILWGSDTKIWAGGIVIPWVVWCGHPVGGEGVSDTRIWAGGIVTPWWYYVVILWEIWVGGIVIPWVVLCGPPMGGLTSRYG